ncbi:hypothetical protein ACQ4PT_063474 [Festuca glaucescens]
MADAAWKARFRQRVVTAVDCFLAADQVLELADPIFHGQVDVVAAAAALDPAATTAIERRRLKLSLDSLGRHQAEVEPEPVVEGVIARLKTACTVAMDSYEVFDSCCGHLSTAIALLDATGILNAGVLVEQERQIVAPALRYAIGRHREARDQASAPRQMLTP